MRGPWWRQAPLICIPQQLNGICVLHLDEKNFAQVPRTTAAVHSNFTRFRALLRRTTDARAGRESGGLLGPAQRCSFYSSAYCPSALSVRIPLLGSCRRWVVGPSPNLPRQLGLHSVSKGVTGIPVRDSGLDHQASVGRIWLLL